MQGRWYPYAILAVASFVAATAYAATKPKSVLLEESDYFETTTSAGLVACGLVGGKWIPGTQSKSTTRLFTSRAAQLKALKKDRDLASSVFAKQKIEKKIIKIQKTQKREAATCKPGPASTPTPVPGAPTATPTPTPTVQGCYDQSRNTSCFGIPNGVVGNENDGLALFASNCESCHNGSIEPEPRNRTYSQIDAAFSNVTQMNLYIGSFSQTQIADLTAYLNRYNPNQ